MKKRVLQGLAVTGTLVIVVAGIYFLDKFVFGAIEAEKKIAAYEEYYYGIASDADMHFNWKMGSGYVGGGYSYNPDSDLILDGMRSNESRAYFEQTMEVIDTYDINIEFADYGVITYYDGSDVSVQYDDLYIYEFYNTQFVEEDKRIETGATLIWETLSWDDLEYCNINGVHVDYYDPTGVIRYSIGLDKSRTKTSDITEKMLINSAREVSFDGNLLLEEKWERYYSQRKKFFSFEMDGYEISLEGIELCGDYQLMMRGNGTTKVIETMYFRTDDGELCKYSYDYFDDVLGYSGFVFDVTKDCIQERKYYTIVNGKPICIAHAYLTENQSSFDETCFVRDIDGDGITELIVNEEETLFVNGNYVNLEEKYVLIFMRNNDEILKGYGGAMRVWDLDYLYPKYLESWYLPESNKLVKKYYDEDGTIFEEEYDINLDKIGFKRYTYVN